MNEVLECLEQGFDIAAEYCTLFLEIVGAVILMASAIRALVRLIRTRRHRGLGLAQGIALALEFMMGGEVLRSALVRTRGELLILGTVIAMRAAMALLIHWETKAERAEEARDQESSLGV